MGRALMGARPRCSCCAGSGYDALAVDDDGGAVTCWACDGTGHDERAPADWPPEYARARAEGDAWAERERQAFESLRGEMKTLTELIQQAERR